MSTSTFGFNQNDTGINTRIPRFKGETRRTYRLGLGWWPNIEKETFNIQDLTVPEGQEEESLTPRFVRGVRNFVPNVGYVLNKGPEYAKLIGETGKVYIGTVVISWPLDPKRKQVTKESVFERMPDVLCWVFAAGHYEKLKKMHTSGYPMHDWDVQAECEDGTFQKFTFLPARQCLFKEMLKNNNDKAQEIAAYILEQVRDIVPHIGREIGQDLTLDQLREKMGGQVAGPVSGLAGDKEVDDLLGSMLDD